MRRTLPFGSIIDKNYRSHNRIKTEEKRQKKEGQRKNAVLRRRRNSGKEQNSKKNQNSGKASALCIDGPDGGVLFQPHLDAGAVLASFYN